MLDEAYDLTFRALPYGTHEGRYDLSSLLYIGASCKDSHQVMELIGRNTFGSPDLRRLSLVVGIHEELTSLIVRGVAHTTVKNRIRVVRRFYAWGDNNKAEMTKDRIADVYRLWVEHLLHRVRIEKSIYNTTAYQLAKAVDNILKPVLNMSYGLISTTRLSASSTKHKALGSKADKQNLADAFEFGHFLMDVSLGLDVQAMTGPLPVVINLRNGEAMTELAGLSNLALEDSYAVISERKIFLERRAPIGAELVFSKRKKLANLRISAELLIFISQTGMNLSQASKLKRGGFRYQTNGENILVYRVYKGRRHGEAEFIIFREYAPLFRRYLEWLDILSDPEDERLFPTIFTSKIPTSDHLPTFEAIISRCKKFGIKPFGPQTLRKTRINWFLRKSRSPDLTADLAQHTKETLIRVYEEPNHQAAAAEISRFYRETDPGIASVGPGMCGGDGKPLPFNGPQKSPYTADCTIPAGCMYCEHQRDIDSQDYVWSLASYRHMKMLELDRYVPPIGDHPPHPISLLVGRINSKLKYFADSGDERASWLKEAEMRLQEGRFHENYDGLIQLMELSE